MAEKRKLWLEGRNAWMYAAWDYVDLLLAVLWTVVYYPHITDVYKVDFVVLNALICTVGFVLAVMGTRNAYVVFSQRRSLAPKHNQKDNKCTRRAWIYLQLSKAARVKLRERKRTQGVIQRSDLHDSSDSDSSDTSDAEGTSRFSSEGNSGDEAKAEDIKKGGGEFSVELLGYCPPQWVERHVSRHVVLHIYRELLFDIVQAAFTFWLVTCAPLKSGEDKFTGRLVMDAANLASTGIDFFLVKGPEAFKLLTEPADVGNRLHEAFSSPEFEADPAV